MKQRVLELARECGFDLAGIAPARPLSAFPFYQDWVRKGRAGAMTYLADHRGDVRADPRQLLPSARSILCCGVLYNSRHAHSTEMLDRTRAWISRYAWGDDYHDVLRRRFTELERLLRSEIAEPFDARICVDTAPLLERSYARQAGLGWIGKNTCLINQQQGSWFFLGEMLLSLELAVDEPPPDRCGSCSRCIDACPTAAIVPTGHAAPAWELDSTLCISYQTIESRDSVPEALRPAFGSHVFGCDICQDVCPWNSRAPETGDAAFEPKRFAPPLAELAELSEEGFRDCFRYSPVWRAKYRGFLRNVATAMGNAGRPEYRAALEKMAAHADAVVAEHARWALLRLVDQLPAEEGHLRQGG